MADKKGFKIRISTEDAASAGLDKIDAKIDGVSRSATEASRAQTAGARSAGAADEDLARKVDQVGDALQASGRAAAAAGAAQKASAATAEEGVAGLRKQLDQLRNLYFAIQGGGAFASTIKSLADTADQYNNLAARIKLATGAGQAFDAAFGEVIAISQRTQSSLEATGALFTRLTDAGKSAGLATQAAIQQSLALTETINQAAQLSGGSAESANAAITQLIQGFQSGVLRGDEFNAVMEQAPRLAKALADGLGVTTGELRKMAEAGRLSSATVISALRSQASTLRTEFATLPPTIGRALENLSTAWTVYIGQADQAGGASASVANALKLLADNLSTVSGLLIDVGQAAAAFAALRLAQTFLGLRDAAAGAAVQLSATAASTRSVAVSGQALAATTTAAAVGIGRLASLLATLRTFTFVGLIANLQDIGKWIGESLAKLSPEVRKQAAAMRELESSERARAAVAKAMADMDAELAAKTKAAADAAFGLNKESLALVAEFKDLREKGDSVAEALDKLAKKFDFSDLKGINDAVVALDALAQQGKITGDQLRASLQGALDGKDLMVFETSARAAFAAGEDGARRMARVHDAVLQEAIRRTGLEVGELRKGINETAQRAINDFDALSASMNELKGKGIDVGVALGASLDKALSAAKTEAAVQAVIDRLTQLGDQGVLTGDKLAAGLDKARAKLDELKPGINSVAEALKSLGITSDAELKKTAAAAESAFNVVRSGGGSVREVEAAFEAYAKKAIAAHGGVASEFLKTKAEMLGMADVLDKITGKTKEAADASKGISSGFEDARKSLNGLSAEARGAAGNFQAMAAGATMTADKIREAHQEQQSLTALSKYGPGYDRQGFAADADGKTISAAGRSELEALAARAALAEQKFGAQANSSAAQQWASLALQLKHYEDSIAENNAHGGSGVSRGLQMAMDDLKAGMDAFESQVRRETSAQPARPQPGQPTPPPSQPGPPSTTIIVRFQAPTGESVGGLFDDNASVQRLLDILRRAGAVVQGL